MHVRRATGGALAAACFSLVSCVTASYQPPAAAPEAIAEAVVVRAPYDRVWRALSSHVATPHFRIESRDPKKGAVVASFRPSNVAAYIDCGAFIAHRGGPFFEGPWVGYAERYLRAQFEGHVRVAVERAGAGATRVRVTIRYVFGTPPQYAGRAFAPPQNWIFDSGNSATVDVHVPAPGTVPARTCRPTGAAERELLAAVGAPQ